MARHRLSWWKRFPRATTLVADEEAYRMRLARARVRSATVVAMAAAERAGHEDAYRRRSAG